ncbi:large ribosomal subunit protein mL48-like [Saccoglossus kowalevskii]|uniref:39S ribosomal protein L48, mitochondrial-like n=1 Tax=Saccoglossus kowalevskii TaxID=10224 RepID=A0ABM0GUT1_SACKO|nr:PREDICTED: 39S ribosomal protein L48, mitochondrial-like [Saccoglossus kowalevskii]
MLQNLAARLVNSSFRVLKGVSDCSLQRVPCIVQQRTQSSQVNDDDSPDISENHYPTLNIHVTGHDLTVVEHYAQYLHNMSKNLGIIVSDSYALPTKTHVAKTLQKPGINVKPRNITLKTFERVVQVDELLSTKASLLTELLQINMPQGVSVKIQEHTEEHYQDRFLPREVPDFLLK